MIAFNRLRGRCPRYVRGTLQFLARADGGNPRPEVPLLDKEMDLRPDVCLQTKVDDRRGSPRGKLPAGGLSGYCNHVCARYFNMEMTGLCWHGPRAGLLWRMRRSDAARLFGAPFAATISSFEALDPSKAHAE